MSEGLGGLEGTDKAIRAGKLGQTAFKAFGNCDCTHVCFRPRVSYLSTDTLSLSLNHATTSSGLKLSSQYSLPPAPTFKL
ncbi:hypothetical protein PIB30_062025, partial [Stylosanthes scabra]|nr:hypothetical protein [Stylosanthes scabra]